MGKVIFGDNLEGFFEDFPQFDGLIVGREKVVRGILPAAPFNLVDLFLDFEGFEVVEFGLVGLEFGVEFVLAGLFLFTCQYEKMSNQRTRRTVSFLSNKTTRPPLSPVAR